LIFGLITKIVYNRGRVKEQIEYISFKGVWQVPSSETMKIVPEHQRSWKHFDVHSDPSLSLKKDDRISYNNGIYRVFSKRDYSEYGYIHYIIVEDYQGSDPSVVDNN
jgi:hypothetical protein